MLAIIPARGNSKGIKGKNIYQLCGKPLLQYTIDAALESNYISKIILSTDDIKIAKEGLRLGLKNEYTRPKNLAADNTSMAETVLHCLNWVENNVKSFDNFIILQPTSPLRLTLDIDKSIEEFYKKKSLSLVSINKMIEHPNECIEIKKSGNWKFLRNTKATKRQDYNDNYYFINGAIYILNTMNFKKKLNIIDDHNTSFYEMPKERSIDIDSYDDLIMAEAFLKQN